MIKPALNYEQNIKKTIYSKKLPAYTGADSIFERMKILLEIVDNWNK